MAEGAVGYLGDAEFLGRADEAVCFVEGFKGRVLCLDSVNLGDCVRVSL